MSELSKEQCVTKYPELLCVMLGMLVGNTTLPHSNFYISLTSWLF